MTKTSKEDILDTARQMFNEQGLGNVTMAGLARALGVTNGNLWYHFKNKAALVDALLEQLDRIQEARASDRPGPHGDVLYEAAVQLQLFARELDDFRFVYRDLHLEETRSRNADRLRKRRYTRSREKILDFLLEMKRQGHLKIQEGEVSGLAYRILMVVRHNIEFMRESGMSYGSRKDPVTATLLCQFDLYGPLMKRGSCDRFRQLLLDARLSNRIKAESRMMLGAAV